MLLSKKAKASIGVAIVFGGIIGGVTLHKFFNKDCKTIFYKERERTIDCYINNGMVYTKYDWSTWSEWSLNQASQSENIEVQTKEGYAKRKEIVANEIRRALNPNK